jgi:predicted regulator of Ras-like GTPase activity (Roadblock/LC7/MglB family)
MVETVSKDGELMTTRTTADILAALGSAFSATLLGVAARDLDVMPVLGDRLLEELRKRGFAVYRQAEGTTAEPGS